MTNKYDKLKVFVSSPGDTVQERKACTAVIQNIRRVCGDALGIVLETVVWEDLPPVTPAPSDGSIQDQINRRIRDCHFFILILNSRYGSIENGKHKSNTEREIEEALRVLQTNRKMTILAYFRESVSTADKGMQFKKLEALKSRLRRESKVLSKSYRNAYDFEQKLTHDLYDLIIRIRHSTYKHQMISRVFKLGRHDPERTPRLAIIYPPVPRRFMGGVETDNLWQERLAPNMSFEDFSNCSGQLQLNWSPIK